MDDTAVLEFIDSLPLNQRAISEHLHNLLCINAELQPRIRYRIPFYYHRSWICYLNPIKSDGVELAFTRGNELSNIQGILEHKGRSQVSGVSFFSTAQISETAILEILYEALILDEGELK